MAFRSHARNSAANRTDIASAKPATPWRDRPFQQMQTASEIAGLSPASLYRFAAEGRLILKKLGGRTLVDTSSLIALIGEAEPWSPSDRADRARAARADRAQAAREV